MPATNMEKYLVGGAVRDLIMGKKPKDRDYAVIGETPESMALRGFLQVGADFPVFLHPETKEEYALARTERKNGKTRLDFETKWTGVTLTEDLSRRDLTMNAIALDDNGAFIDPFGGRADIENKILRHVGPAFGEDELRVLRVARFAAQTGFSIAPETVDLCRSMVAAGELDTLTPERVSQELIKALQSPKPSRFFTALDRLGALEKLFPEVHALKGQTQPVKHHEEGDAYIHTLLVLDKAPCGDALIAFAALAHDLGKGKTPRHLLPNHYGEKNLQTGVVTPGHEEAGAPIAANLARRLRLPSEYERLAEKCALMHTYVHRTNELRPSRFVTLFEQNGGITRMGDFETITKVAEADYRGHHNAGVRADPAGGLRNAERFMGVMNAIAKVRVTDFATPDQIKTMGKEKIKIKLFLARTKAAKSHLAATVAIVPVRQACNER